MAVRLLGLIVAVETAGCGPGASSGPQDRGAARTAEGTNPSAPPFPAHPDGLVALRRAAQHGRGVIGRSVATRATGPKGEVEQAWRFAFDLGSDSGVVRERSFAGQVAGGVEKYFVATTSVVSTNPAAQVDLPQARRFPSAVLMRWLGDLTSVSEVRADEHLRIEDDGEAFSWTTDAGTLHLNPACGRLTFWKSSARDGLLVLCPAIQDGGDEAAVTFSHAVIVQPNGSEFVFAPLAVRFVAPSVATRLSGDLLNRPGQAIDEIERSLLGRRRNPFTKE